MLLITKIIAESTLIKSLEGDRESLDSALDLFGKKGLFHEEACTLQSSEDMRVIKSGIGLLLSNEWMKGLNRYEVKWNHNQGCAILYRNESLSADIPILDDEYAKQVRNRPFRTLASLIQCTQQVNENYNNAILCFLTGYILWQQASTHRVAMQVAKKLFNRSIELGFLGKESPQLECFKKEHRALFYGERQILNSNQAQNRKKNNPQKQQPKVNDFSKELQQYQKGKGRWLPKVSEVH